MSGFIEGEDRHQATLFPERLDDYIGEAAEAGLEQKPSVMQTRRATVEHPFGTLKATRDADQGNPTVNRSDTGIGPVCCLLNSVNRAAISVHCNSKDARQKRNQYDHTQRTR